MSILSVRFHPGNMMFVLHRTCIEWKSILLAAQQRMQADAAGLENSEVTCGEYDMNLLGKTTNRLRTAKEISREELARRAEVSAEWLGRLEQGRLPQTEYHLQQLRQVAAALGYSFVGFLREAGLVEASEVKELSGDPALRQLVANYSALGPEERDAVDELIRLLTKRGEPPA